MIRGLFPVWLFASFVSVFCSAHANAACELLDIHLPTPQLDVNDVPNDTTQVGVMLAQPVLSGRQIISNGECPHGSSYEGTAHTIRELESSGKSISYGGNVYTLYKSGVDGLGFAVGINSPTRPSGFTPISMNTDYAMGGVYANPDWLEVMVIYASTGPIAPGVYSFPETRIISLIHASNNGLHDLDQSFVFIDGGTLVYEGAGCDLIDGQVNVNLRQVVAGKYFQGVGSVSPVKDFSIPLQCNGAVAIDMTVSSTGAVDANKGLLKVAAGGATGVAIQLLKDDGVTPFPLGKEVRVVTQAVEGRNNIDLAARYYQNASKVVVGKAAGTAQFTLKYR